MAGVEGLPVTAPTATGSLSVWSALRQDLVGLPLLWGVELLILGIRMHDRGPVHSLILILSLTFLYFPLFWRRQHPLAVFCWLVVTSTVISVLAPGFHPIFCLWLGLFAAAAHCRRESALIALFLAVVPAGFNVAETLRDTSDPSDRPIILVSVSLFLLLANLIAYGVGRWTRWSVEQRALVARLAAARAEAEERRRIARELHDVVAHAVSLMVLQAAGAERMLDRNPDRARTALHQVGDLGEQAITELRRMLGYLAPVSANAGSEDHVPVRLDDIDVLIDQLRSAGREVVLSSTGRRLPLDPATDTSAYRIVQEALTNAVKYADAREPVRLIVNWKADAVELCIHTRGSAIARHDEPSRFSTGNGIRGMQERAKAVGGTVTAEPASDGGYRVSAWLPVATGSDSATPPRRAPLVLRILEGRI
ncbi:histidine kinase [Kocuria kalidii]|uniref:sensor histidine kinase n=1 Tax=Kocuria kalidii TaxID=3376283 RepID=UPI0037A14A08